MITIAIWFLAIVVAIILGVISFIWYSRYKELKIKEQKQNYIAKECRAKQQDFRAQMAKVKSTGFIDVRHKQAILMLINNYFVYQPINEINHAHFIELFDEVETCLNKFLTAPKEAQQIVAPGLTDFAELLPNSAANFDASFYLDRAPILVAQFHEHIDRLIEEATLILNPPQENEEEEEEEVALSSSERVETDSETNNEQDADKHIKQTLEIHKQHNAI